MPSKRVGGISEALEGCWLGAGRKPAGGHQRRCLPRPRDLPEPDVREPVPTFISKIISRGLMLTLPASFVKSAVYAAITSLSEAISSTGARPRNLFPSDSIFAQILLS